MVVVYTWRFCPFCIRAKRLLDQKGVQYQEIAAEDPERLNEMKRLSGRSTVPQIWIGEHHVGGFSELRDLESKGELDGLLAEAS